MSSERQNSFDNVRDDSADVMCYAVFFGNKTSAFRHMQKARELRKKHCCIIAFGPFASVFFEEVLSRGLADIVVTRDPEFVIPLILQKNVDPKVLSAIPNLSYRCEGKIVHTPRYSFHDLDAIPFIGPYLCSQGHRGYIMTARGCQHHCIFCDRNVFWGGGVRKRSVKNVLREIDELVGTRHVRHIEFIDEDLAADQGRLAVLCKGIRLIKGNFSWSCSVCVNSATKDLLFLLGRSRCREIYFGVKSVSPQVLRRMGKKQSRQEMLNAVRWAQDAGLKADVMITSGNPGETDQDREMTLSALNEMGPRLKL